MHFGKHVVSSTLPFPALPASAGIAASTIDVGIAAAGVPAHLPFSHHWTSGDEIVLSLAPDGSDYWLRIAPAADFHLQLEPCRVAVSPDAAALDPATLEHMLVDQILPRLLAQLGHLLVHASATSIGARHVLFLGPSGAGKSTLAGLLQQRGHTVYSDDCVQLDAVGAHFEATPTYPSLRLLDDSLAAVFVEQPHTTAMADYSNKRRVALELPHGANQGVPVDAIYLLGDPADAPADGSTRITALRPAEACLALIRHSFRLDMHDKAASAAQLARCSAVARAVPAWRLDYERDHALHDALAQAIATHLADACCDN